jgi:hypothetical protein
VQYPTVASKDGNEPRSYVIDIVFHAERKRGEATDGCATDIELVVPGVCRGNSEGSSGREGLSRSTDCLPCQDYASLLAFAGVTKYKGLSSVAERWRSCARGEPPYCCRRRDTGGNSMVLAHLDDPQQLDVPQRRDSVPFAVTEFSEEYL